ncbi:hypothetical protein EV384_2550 [Micromonospora kangleipakensis]|uniref:Uncharacterized protein n=1 Tax=Micromonospora kangleipakensis TaxID=1077942 RepID=A0A4Q8B9D8_9ACTN|nr:hypothetical protein [Micromonospora kangleipakensis]RZU74108.1 hypothetical protein EV384_2550 [Micromonospora kangleipakensis]
MKRTLLAMLLVLTLTIGAGVVWGRHLIAARELGGSATDSRMTTDGRVATGDGRLSVDLPADWAQQPCPPVPPTCLHLAPPAAGPLDRITVLVFRPEADADPVEYYLDIPPGTPNQPSLQWLTVDGMQSVRSDPDWSPGPRQTGPGAAPVIMVAGRIPGGKEIFMVYCGYEHRRTEIRAGCDLVTGSLRVKR